MQVRVELLIYTIANYNKKNEIKAKVKNDQLHKGY